MDYVGSKTKLLGQISDKKKKKKTWILSWYHSFEQIFKLLISINLGQVWKWVVSGKN